VIPTFAEALRAEPDRFLSDAFARRCRQYFWNFMYCRSTLYGEQLDRYLRLLDRSQFQVLTLAELASVPEETTRRILEFFDLDPSPAAAFDY
jgi:hypothetical protein